MSDEEIRWRMNRDPYICSEAEGYVTAINILAIEYLIKANNREEYNRWIRVLSKAELSDLEILKIHLGLNRHTSSLGAMITQGDYENQREDLMEFLEELENERKD